MKKSNVLKVTSLLLTVCMLLPLFTGAVQATSVSSSVATDELTLDANSVPELMSYESAVQAGHLFRLTEEEPQLNCVIFRNADSSDTIYIFNEDVKYIDSDGVVRDKKNDLVRQLDGSYQNRANNVTVTYPAKIADGVQVQSGSLTLQVAPAYANNSAASALQPSKNSAVKTVSYADAFGTGTALRFSQTYSGFSEEIVLNREGVKEISFTVSTNGASIVMVNGAACVYLGGKHVGTFGEVCVYDAESRSVVGTMAVAELTANQTYRITMTIPAAFLEDAVYPVVAKPAFSVVGSSPAIEKVVIAPDSASRGSDQSAVAFPGLEQIAGLLQKYRNIERGIVSAKYVFSGAAKNVRQEAELKSFVDSWNAGTPDYGVKLSASGKSGILGSTSENMPYLLLETEPIVNENNRVPYDNGIYQITSVDYDYAISYADNGVDAAESDTTTRTQHFRIYRPNDQTLLHQVIPLYNMNLCMTGCGANAEVEMCTNIDQSTRRWYITQEEDGYRFYYGAGIYVLAYDPVEIDDNSIYGRVLTWNSLDNSLWEMERIEILDVPLNQQEEDYTCSGACSLMILDYFGCSPIKSGLFSSEVDFEQYIYDNSPSRAISRVTEHINNYLQLGGSNVQYTSYWAGGINNTETSFRTLLTNSLSNGYPVLINIHVPGTGTLEYYSHRHYIVLTAIYYDNQTNTYMAVINDPHYNNAYFGQQVLPFSELYEYCDDPDYWVSLVQ